MLGGWPELLAPEEFEARRTEQRKLQHFYRSQFPHLRSACHHDLLVATAAMVDILSPGGSAIPAHEQEAQPFTSKWASRYRGVRSRFLPRFFLDISMDTNKLYIGNRGRSRPAGGALADTVGPYLAGAHVGL